MTTTWQDARPRLAGPGAADGHDYHHHETPPRLKRDAPSLHKGHGGRRPHQKQRFGPTQVPATGNSDQDRPARCQAKRFSLAPCQLWMVPLLLLLLTVAVPSALGLEQAPSADDWHYTDQVRWGRVHRGCAGRAQSPVDIQQRGTVISPNLRLLFYNYNLPVRFKLSNAFHTIKMSPFLEGALGQAQAGLSGDHATSSESVGPEWMVDKGEEFGGQNATADTRSQQKQHLDRESPAPDVNKIRPHGDGAGEASGGANPVYIEEPGQQQQPAGARWPGIKLDWLDEGLNEFELRDVHFHWGERRDNGSEHAIDGRRAAMEMHLVHVRAGVDRARIGQVSDSVVVIGILIESHRKSNADFNPIVNELARINATEQTRDIDYKSLYDLLPGNLNDFYTYSGSLTIPPCFQVVNWIVMAERLNMNAKQIEMFRNLYAPPHPDGSPHSRAPKQQTGDEATRAPPAPSLMLPNVRLLQPLNNRTILASFSKQGSRLRPARGGSGSVHAKLLAAHPLLNCPTNILIVVCPSLLSVALQLWVGRAWSRQRW